MNTEKDLINLSSELQIDKELEKIWFNRYDDNKEIVAPLFPEELYTNSITYLSLNPSLLPKNKESAKRGNNPNLKYPLVDWRIEEGKGYPFFQKFYDLGKEEKEFEPWTIMDLLYERVTNQNILKDKYKKRTILNEDKTFLLNQIRLTFKILKFINPKVVVVSNAFAHTLIHQNLSELNITQEIPSEENNYIYRLNGMPFITNESKFLGGYPRYKEKYTERRKKLPEEIKRVLNITSR